MNDLIKRTADCSGSDLKELCRNAAMIPTREYVRSVQKQGDFDGTSDSLLDIDTSVRNPLLNIIYIYIYAYRKKSYTNGIMILSMYRI